MLDRVARWACLSGAKEAPGLYGQARCGKAQACDEPECCNTLQGGDNCILGAQRQRSLWQSSALYVELVQGALADSPAGARLPRDGVHQRAHGIAVACAVLPHTRSVSDDASRWAHLHVDPAQNGSAACRAGYHAASLDHGLCLWLSSTQSKAPSTGMYRHHDGRQRPLCLDD